MRTLQFSPIEHTNLVEADKYSAYDDPTVRAHTDEFESALRGVTTDQTYLQADWMGRGCYQQMPNGEFLLGKGVGPGPGSEEMRKFLDELWNARAGNDKVGGCLRLGTQCDYPLLLQFIERGDGWAVMDPRPEGFSIFGALYREGLSGEIYDRLGVRSVAPVRLFRNNVTPPYIPTGDSSGIDRFIEERFSQAVADYLGRNRDCRAVAVEENTYFDMDGGVLVRKAKTPHRIANLHMAVMSGDTEFAQELAQEAETELANVSVPSELKDLPVAHRLAWVLGETAAKLFGNHIIHGQLNIHYQNVSTVGELADFDSTVFLDAYSGDNTLLAAANATRQQLYNELWRKLQEGEAKFDVTMLPFLQEDFERTIGGPTISQMDTGLTASNILGQIYDLFLQSLRGIDLIERSRLNIPNDDTGTVLNEEQIVYLKQVFAYALKLGAGDMAEEFKRVLDTGYERFRNSYLDKKGKTTIYGWHYKNAPLNHMVEKCDDQRASFIQRDADELFTVIERAFI